MALCRIVKYRHAETVKRDKRGTNILDRDETGVLFATRENITGVLDIIFANGLDPTTVEAKEDIVYLNDLIFVGETDACK